VIRLHPSEHSLAGTPYVTFEEAGCTFCGDCVKVCPAATDGAPGSPRIGLAILDQAACIAWNGVICIRCQVSCTWSAIAMDAQGRPAVDADPCTGCGLCVSVCPTKAIRITS
jgi:ferredoxin-type protein NapF